MKLIRDICLSASGAFSGCAVFEFKLAKYDIAIISIVISALLAFTAEIMPSESKR